MLAVSSSNTELTLIRYPKLTKDPACLFEKLQPVLNDIKFKKFSKVYGKTICPGLVNKFNKDDN